MDELREFLIRFFKNKGHFVFLSFLIAKITGFLNSIVVIRLLPEHEFGILTIALSLFSIFVPFSGLGSCQILLRFGVIGDSENYQEKLSSYLFYKGLLYEFILVLAFLLISTIYISRYDNILIILLFMSVRLLGFYFFSHIQSFYRIIGKNDVFAKVNNINNIVGFILLFIFTYFWKFNGYLIAFAIIPYLSLFWFKKSMISSKNFIPINTRKLWKFGIFTAFTAVISEALFSLDVILLAFFMNETVVANYKVAILLPSNITFLAISFMQSDYPMLSKNYLNKSFLSSYIKNYYKLFIPICICIFIAFWLLKDILIKVFFGKDYIQTTSLMMVLLVGFIIGMLSRNLYGNLLPAVGKVKINTKVSILSLLFLSVAAYFLVPYYGVLGMGMALSLIIIWEGSAYAYFFIKYLKNL